MVALFKLHAFFTKQAFSPTQGLKRLAKFDR